MLYELLIISYQLVVYHVFSAKLWQTVDNIVHHVVHTTDSCIESAQSDIRQFPEQFGLGMQCVFSYQEAVKLSSSSIESGISSGKSSQSSTDNRVQKTSYQARCQTMDNGKSQHVSTRKNDSGSSGNSCDNSCGSHDNSESQNRTVTIFRHNSTDQEDSTSGCNSLDDKTVIVKNKYYSPTELTFFSNKLSDSTSSPLNDCSKSNYDRGSICPPCNEDMSSSISSKLSCHGNNTYSKSDSNDCLGMNINLPENKAYEYDQKKVKDKLLTMYSLSPSDSKLGNKSLSSTPGQTKKNNDMLKVGNSVQSANDRPAYTDVKYVNSMKRPDVPKPTRPLSHFKWISLPDDKIGKRSLIMVNNQWGKTK